MTLKNSHEIIDNIAKQQDKLDELNPKGKKGQELMNEIDITKKECLELMRKVMKNLYPKRKLLDVFLPRSDEEDTEIMFCNRDDFKKKKKWYSHGQLCLHPEGLSILSSYQDNSNIIFNLRTNDTINYLKMIKNNKKLNDLLKKELKPEKFEILDIILKEIDKISYEPELIINNKINLMAFKERDKIENKLFERSEMDVYGGVKMTLMGGVVKDYYDLNVTFPCQLVDLGELMLIEQAYEEISQNVDAYLLYLGKVLDEAKSYLKYLNEKFIRHLILLNLKPVKGGVV